MSESQVVLMEQYAGSQSNGKTAATSHAAFSHQAAGDAQRTDHPGVSPRSGFDHHNDQTQELHTHRSNADPVTIRIMPVQGLLMLRAAEQAEALSAALDRQYGVPLPDTLRSTADGTRHYVLRWMSPDAWLLSCPLHEAFSIEQALRDEVPGHLAIVNVSGGYSALSIEGRYAQQVLMKSTGYDVHPDNLPAGKVVNTAFAKTQVTLRAVQRGNTSDSPDNFELIVRRSLSDYLMTWLQRAADEYGVLLQH